MYAPPTCVSGPTLLNAVYNILKEAKEDVDRQDAVYIIVLGKVDVRDLVETRGEMAVYGIHGPCGPNPYVYVRLYRLPKAPTVLKNDEERKLRAEDRVAQANVRHGGYITTTRADFVDLSANLDDVRNARGDDFVGTSFVFRPASHAPKQGEVQVLQNPKEWWTRTDRY